MSGELLINVTPSETRVALIENGTLQEVHVERNLKLIKVSNKMGNLVTITVKWARANATAENQQGDLE